MKSLPFRAWWRALQHAVGVANGCTLLDNLADASYLLATLSLACMLLTASWRID